MGPRPRAAASCMATLAGLLLMRAPSHKSWSRRLTLSASSVNDEERFKAILADESMNPENLKASAEQMKNMKPEDVDAMIAEMDRMPAAQREQLTRLGMDFDTMKQTMEMMKENPDMARSMGQLMEMIVMQ